MILTDEEFDRMRNEIGQLPTKAERKQTRQALREMVDVSAEFERKRALGILGQNTSEFLNAMVRLDRHYSTLASKAGALDTSALNKIADSLAELRVAFGVADESPDAPGATPVPDETQVPPVADAAPFPAPGPTIERQPVTSSETSFRALADEYVRFFRGMKFRADRKGEIERLAASASRNKARYEDAAGPIGVPWWFIAGIHMLESSFRFTGHLHNGDPLSARTQRIPKGRPLVDPATGGRYSWEESATDAMRFKGYGGLIDWSLPRALYRWEAYNGFGYRMSDRLVPTPYLWSFSRIYSKGKFASDGNYYPELVSQQCGAAVLLRALMDLGTVQGVTIDVAEEPPTAAADSDVLGPEPPKDVIASDSHPFARFFNENIGPLLHFEWKEFLFKGDRHASNGLNTDPPTHLYPNIIEAARALDVFRDEYDAPVHLTSIYRSEAYNARIDGASASKHKEFLAVDFFVKGKGTPQDWKIKLSELRNRGIFSGPIGIYNTFVHLDTRKSASRDWDFR